MSRFGLVRPYGYKPEYTATVRWFVQSFLPGSFPSLVVECHEWGKSDPVCTQILPKIPANWVISQAV